MFCPKCGTEISEEAVFCPKCRNKLENGIKVIKSVHQTGDSKEENNGTQFKILLLQYLEENREKINAISYADKQEIFLMPSIPEDKINKVLSTYALGNTKNNIYLLYDATVSGSAKDGFILTGTEFIAKQFSQESCSITYKNIGRLEVNNAGDRNKNTMTIHGKNGDTINYSGIMADVAILAEIIKGITQLDNAQIADKTEVPLEINKASALTMISSGFKMLFGVFAFLMIIGIVFVWFINLPGIRDVKREIDAVIDVGDEFIDSALNGETSPDEYSTVAESILNSSNDAIGDNTYSDINDFSEYTWVHYDQLMANPDMYLGTKIYFECYFMEIEEGDGAALIVNMDRNYMIVITEDMNLLENLHYFYNEDESVAMTVYGVFDGLGSSLEFDDLPAILADEIYFMTFDYNTGEWVVNY